MCACVWGKESMSDQSIWYGMGMVRIVHTLHTCTYKNIRNWGAGHANNWINKALIISLVKYTLLDAMFAELEI